MLKTDYKREVENTLKILTDRVDEALIEGKGKEVIPIIESEIKSLVGIDLELLNTLSFESATEIISRENQYNFLKYIALGEALKLMGIVYFSINEDSKGLYYYEKASEAFFEADAEEDIESEYHKSIEIILDKLRNLMNLRSLRSLRSHIQSLNSLSSLFSLNSFLLGVVFDACG